MKCPNCGNKQLKKYVYGYRGMCEDNEVLGGCMISFDSPTYYCEECENSFGTYSTYYELKEDNELLAVLSKFPRSKGVDIYEGAKIKRTQYNEKLIAKLSKTQCFIEKDEYLVCKNYISLNTFKEASLLISGNPEYTKSQWTKIDTVNNFNYVEQVIKMMCEK